MQGRMTEISPLSPRWRFDMSEPWTVTVDVPKFPERTADLCDILVPSIAAQRVGYPSTPSVVVVRATVASRHFRPKGRAKGFMDALHDKRKSGKKYAQLGVQAPLLDDDGGYVRGLAVEVTYGLSNSLEYRIGTDLLVNGAVAASVPVGVAAPNDIWADRDERRRIEADRVPFAKALAAAWAQSVLLQSGLVPAALVIRHHPTRDMDNTWGTWISALIGASWSTARTGRRDRHSNVGHHWPLAVSPIRICRTRPTTKYGPSPEGDVSQ